MANDKTYDRHINIWINGKAVNDDISSIKKAMLNLTNEVNRTTRGTEEYNQKVAELRKVKQILKDHQDDISATGGAWNRTKEIFTGALGKIITTGGIVTGAIALIKKGIESTEGSANTLKEEIALLSGGIQGFFHTALSGDWKNIINNITTTAKATKDLTAAEIELEHIKAGQDYAKDQLEFLKNEAIVKANESKDAADRKKYLEDAIDYQKQITAINIDELTKRSGLDEDYYRKLAGEDKDYFDQFIKRVPEIAKHYEIQFALMDGYKKRLEELNYLQTAQFGGLTEAQKKEKNYYQLLVYNLEDYKTLQNDLSKPGQWDKFINGLGAITMAGAEGEAALKRLTKQLTTTDIALDKSKQDDLKWAELDEKYTNEYFENEQKRNQKDLEDLKLMNDWTNEFFDNEHKRYLQDLKDKELMDKWTDEYFEKENKRKLTDAENQLEIDADNIFAQIDDEKKKNQILRDEEISAAEKTGASVQLINEKYDKLDKKLDEEKLKTKLQLTADFFGNVATLFGKQTAVGKAAAIAETTINTYASATAAYNALAGIPIVGPVLGIAAAAAAIAAGLANVRNIMKVKTGEKGYSAGGFTGPGGKNEPAGIIHKGEWVANADMVSSPEFGPMIQSLEQARINGMSNYANGGGPGISSSGSAAAGSSSGLIGSNSNLEYLIKQNIRFLALLNERGVKMNFGYIEADNVQKGLDKLSDIRDKVSH